MALAPTLAPPLIHRTLPLSPGGSVTIPRAHTPSQLSSAGAVLYSLSLFTLIFRKSFQIVCEMVCFTSRSFLARPGPYAFS